MKVEGEQVRARAFRLEDIKSKGEPADEPEEAILTIWLLRQMLASAGADFDESLEVLQRYEHSRDSVLREIVAMLYPELPLGDALRSIAQSVPNDEELNRGNPG